jgi:hypothetical protein
MIVRCTSILDPPGDERTSHPDITIGERYVVLAILARPGRDVLLRVYAVRPEARATHQGPPGLWRSEMFEVQSDTIPSNWRVGISGDGVIEVAPESWRRPGFWMDMVDSSPTSEVATRDYERELRIILHESEQIEPS